MIPDPISLTNYKKKKKNRLKTEMGDLESMNLWEENTGKILQDIRRGKDLRDKTPKAQEIKKKRQMWLYKTKKASTQQMKQ